MSDDESRLLEVKDAFVKHPFSDSKGVDLYQLGQFLGCLRGKHHKYLMKTLSGLKVRNMLISMIGPKCTVPPHHLTLSSPCSPLQKVLAASTYDAQVKALSGTDGAGLFLALFSTSLNLLPPAITGNAVKQYSDLTLGQHVLDIDIRGGASVRSSVLVTETYKCPYCNYRKRSFPTLHCFPIH